ncbi:MAG: hypothetical protein AB7V14_12430 [Kiritimatiellia bacterium]
MKTKIVVTLVAALLAASGTAALAADPQGWKIETTPYLWAAGLEGDVTVNGTEVEFDRSFSDIFESVDMAGSILGVVQYNRFLFWGQADYYSMSTDNLDVEDQPEGGKLDVQMMLGELAVGYQIDGWAEGQTFDILVGVRSLTFDNELTVYESGAVYETEDPGQDSRVDGIIVVRPSIPILPSKIDGLRFNPTLAIGGGDSDLVYELFPQIQYQITEHVAARLGYRTVGYKLKGDKNEDNELNVNLAGLIFGVGVTF